MGNYKGFRLGAVADPSLANPNFIPLRYCAPPQFGPHNETAWPQSIRVAEPRGYRGFLHLKYTGTQNSMDTRVGRNKYEGRLALLTCSKSHN